MTGIRENGETLIFIFVLDWSNPCCDNEGHIFKLRVRCRQVDKVPRISPSCISQHPGFARNKDRSKSKFVSGLIVKTLSMACGVPVDIVVYLFTHGLRVPSHTNIDSLGRHGAKHAPKTNQFNSTQTEQKVTIIVKSILF